MRGTYVGKSLGALAYAGEATSRSSGLSAKEIAELTYAYLYRSPA
jgi:hypothetical protein